MNGRNGLGAEHAVRVRTSHGEVWEPGVQHIYSVRLAADVAGLLRAALANPAAPAPEWVSDLREQFDEDGVDVGRCVVELVRLSEDPLETRVLAEFDVTPGAAGVAARVCDARVRADDGPGCRLWLRKG